MYRAVSTKAYDVKGTYPFLCSAFPAFNSYKLVSTFQLGIIFRYVIFDMLKCEGIAEVESRWQSRYFMTVRFKRTFVGQQRSSFFRRCIYPSVVEKFSKYFAKICARVHVYRSFISVVQKEREYGYERKKERKIDVRGMTMGMGKGKREKEENGREGEGERSCKRGRARIRIWNPIRHTVYRFPLLSTQPFPPCRGYKQHLYTSEHTWVVISCIKLSSCWSCKRTGDR